MKNMVMFRHTFNISVTWYTYWVYQSKYPYDITFHDIFHGCDMIRTPSDLAKGRKLNSPVAAEIPLEAWPKKVGETGGGERRCGRV